MRIRCDFCHLDFDEEQILPYSMQKACKFCQIIEEGVRGNVIKRGEVGECRLEKESK